MISVQSQKESGEQRKGEVERDGGTKYFKWSVQSRTVAHPITESEQGLPMNIRFRILVFWVALKILFLGCSQNTLFYTESERSIE